jgi:hypothetical protein
MYVGAACLAAARHLLDRSAQHVTGAAADFEHARRVGQVFLERPENELVARRKPESALFELDQPAKTADIESLVCIGEIRSKNRELLCELRLKPHAAHRHFRRPSGDYHQDKNASAFSMTLLTSAIVRMPIGLACPPRLC